MAAIASTHTDVEYRWLAEPSGEAQRAHGELRRVVDWLTASKKVQRHGEEVRDYWDQRKLLQLKDGVLYQRSVAGDGRPQRLQVIPPIAIRDKYMRRVHCEAAGHLGVRRTPEQVRRRPYWRGWR